MNVSRGYLDRLQREKKLRIGCADDRDERAGARVSLRRGFELVYALGQIVEEGGPVDITLRVRSQE